jgi:8-oxo-dGTP pyrophosphatase MutT (NUDIX family)
MLVEDRYHRATFAKGRLEPGETLPQAALREIAEETGIDGKIQELLGTVSYRYYDPRRGRIDKSVTYYLVEAFGGTTSPQLEEIRAVGWYSLDQADTVYQQRGYDTNKPILGKALKILGGRHGEQRCRP